MNYGRLHYLLYPYHLQDKIVKGLKITPFLYYRSMLIDLITSEKSYDSLPNFTAVDCLRLLGFGRNQFICIVNTYKSFNTVGVSAENVQNRLLEILPSEPVSTIVFEPWYVVHIGAILLSDIQKSSKEEQALIDKIIDSESVAKSPGILVKDIDETLLRKLYARNLIYIEVPLSIDDHISVSVLEGFVMNRISGDIRENILYKVFVTIDKNISIGELADCLQIDFNSILQATSLFCRLGFATRHFVTDSSDASKDCTSFGLNNNSISVKQKKIAVIFDSTIIAYLMMSNSSPRLKSHAVTMFEVGKLSEDSLNSFLLELDHLDCTSEGEIKSFHDNAINLRETINFLKKQALIKENGFYDVDLIKGGSLLNLEPNICNRILHKNYAMIIGLYPSTIEDQQASDINWPVYLGPPSSVANSPWLALFISCVANGALSDQNLSKLKSLPTLLISSGTRITRIHQELSGISSFLVTTWGHETVTVDATELLVLLNEMATTSPVLVQAKSIYDYDARLEQRFIPLPISKDVLLDNKTEERLPRFLLNLFTKIDLTSFVGYITVLAPIKKSNHAPQMLNQNIEIKDGANNSVKNKSTSNNNINFDNISDQTDAVLGMNELIYLTEQNELTYFISIHLGLPIFNADLNRAVCENIQQTGLLNSDRRTKLKASQHSFINALNEFIEEQCCGLLPKFNKLSYSNGVPDKITEPWPLPTHSLICANGCLELL